MNTDGTAWQVIGTGGGCEAWRLEIADAPGVYALATSDLATPEIGERIEVGIYTIADDAADEFALGFFTFDDERAIDAAAQIDATPQQKLEEVARRALVRAHALRAKGYR